MVEAEAGHTLHGMGGDCLGRREHLLQAYGSVVHGNDDESGAALATTPLFMIQP
ncbi:hypothetical protein [Streptomyces sp. NPDC001833]|uniref:hypothetical protein n=1 Tax=Streptomyces sp. NPDC001833 TaxID=3154658 RepID=UPI0033165344